MARLTGGRLSTVMVTTRARLTSRDDAGFTVIAFHLDDFSLSRPGFDVCRSSCLFSAAVAGLNSVHVDGVLVWAPVSVLLLPC